jgi:hypothetical protein
MSVSKQSRRRRSEAVGRFGDEVNVELRNESGRFTAWVKASERSRYYRLGTP